MLSSTLSSSVKNIIKGFLPPVLTRFIGKFMPSIKWRGSYPDWQEAMKNSQGYALGSIVDKVRDATLKLKSGEVAYERDSVLFDEPQYSWPLLYAISTSALKREGECVHVVDFGGALASTYLTHKKFFNETVKVRWSVVEQKSFVEVGTKIFANQCLDFYEDLKVCLQNFPANVFLFSSVLQYLEAPFPVLAGALNQKAEFVVLDRLIFSKDNKEKITVQEVPEKIYKASYPCWLFGEQKFKEFLEQFPYELISEFPVVDADGDSYYFKGFLLARVK